MPKKTRGSEVSKIMNFLKKQSPVRIISMGFALVILIGSILLSLPCSIQDGVMVRYIDLN